MNEILSTTIAATSAIGGWEALRYLINLRTNHRKAEAEADSAEFDVLRQTMEFLQTQLREKEQRFAQQTELVRSLNAEILDLTKMKASLELELQRYRCIRPNCPQREPQNGF